VELTCGGTLLKMAQRDTKPEILHLTAAKWNHGVHSDPRQGSR